MTESDTSMHCDLADKGGDLHKVCMEKEASEANKNQSEIKVSLEQGKDILHHVTDDDHPTIKDEVMEQQIVADDEDDEGEINMEAAVSADEGEINMEAAVSADEGEINMEAAVSADDVLRAGGYGARDDIGRFLPVATDSTDFEASLRDARDFEEPQGETSRPGLGWKESMDENSYGC